MDVSDKLLLLLPPPPEGRLLRLSRGRSSISNFLWRNQQLFQAEMENLKLVESVLDGLIKSCSQQLFEVTDNLENAAYPF